MSESGSMASPRRPVAAVAQRVRRVMDGFVRSRGGGATTTEEELLAAHPDLAPELRRELELVRMLDRAVDEARGGGGSSNLVEALRRGISPPERVGGCRIVREIHRGAQGAVFLAVQESTQRDVAVKVLHSGPLGRPSERARFLREAELLARLRHPHIVAIHDSGVADGLHYFVMDYIEGRSLDEEMRALRRPLRECVEMFAAIADAVAAAHVRGVIHRDLKPSNIRVDAQGRPHVLDFGLAKAVTDETMTADGQFVGSMPWASPEQVRDSRDMDVRSDVYSLGVVLFQVLTGAFPYKVNGSIQDVVRTIATTEPARPCGLRPEIGHELETIILKCLHKLPQRRYQSAGELTADLHRWLAGEVIEAKRDSAIYLLRKSLARYRGVLAAVTGFVVLLAAFAIHFFAQAHQNKELARREHDARLAAEAAGQVADVARREAEAERESARAAQAAEALQRQLAEHETARAEAVTEFLLETLGLADPDVVQTPSPTMRPLLDRAAAEAGARFKDQPGAEAAVRTVLARAYAALGEAEEAREHLARVLHLHDRVLKSPPAAIYPVLVLQVHVLEDLSDYEWRNRWTRLNRLFPELLGGNDAAFVELVKGFTQDATPDYDAQYAEPAYNEIQRRAEESFAENDPRWMILAEMLCMSGGNARLRQSSSLAARMLTDALAIQRRFLPETNTRVVRTLGALVTRLIDDGRFGEAEQLSRDSLASIESLLGAEHWLASLYRARHAACRSGLGDIEQTQETLQTELAALTAARGETNGYSAEICGYLADHFERIGQQTEADAWRASMLERFVRSDQPLLTIRLRQALGRQCPDLCDALDRLRRDIAVSAADYEQIVEEALRGCPRLSGADTAIAGLLCEFLGSGGKARYNHFDRMDAGSRRALEEAVTCYRRSTRVHRYKAGQALFWYGYSLNSRGKYAAAEPILREAVAQFDYDLGSRSYSMACTRSALGESLSRQGCLAEGEALLIRGYEDLRRTMNVTKADRRAALKLLIGHYERTKQDARLHALVGADLKELLAYPAAKANLLEQAAWRIARHPDLPAAAYEDALAAAGRAVALEPDLGDNQRVLGVAYLRLGHAEEARATLQRADELFLTKDGNLDLLTQCFLAMTHADLGDSAAAAASLGVARSRITERRMGTAGNKEWLRQAEKTVAEMAPVVSPAGE
jgi:predicted Ser/Thr protein kinase